MMKTALILSNLAVLVLFVTGCYALNIQSQPEGKVQVADSKNEALPGSFDELLDFHSIPSMKSWRTFQASGYDRGGGFFDSGNFLRIEPDRRYVLMEAEGPGCIDRMWFTYKSDIGKEPYDLLLYIDDPNKPLITVDPVRKNLSSPGVAGYAKAGGFPVRKANSLSNSAFFSNGADLDELFLDKRSPFITPLAGLCGSAIHPGRFCYVPIGFQRYCKVVLVPRGTLDQYQYRINSAGQKIPHIYYQITYRKFEPGTPVKAFRWDIDKQESQSLSKIKSLWQNAGNSPWGELKDLKQNVIGMNIEPDKSNLLFDITGAGTIYGLEFRLENPENLWLSISWDGAADADVFVPIGPFFGCAISGKPKQDVRGFWMGYAKGRYYFYLPMPFRERAKISIVSKNNKVVPISAILQYQNYKPSDSDGLFCAHRYDYQSPAIGKDYTVLDVKGKGHFVGLVMDNPGNMEGDDRFFVDGEENPSIHGTGTEDFFNFAWGLGHTNSFSLHGITIQGSPICYRFHLPAGVPFQKSLHISWEHGHDIDKGPNLHQGRYSGIVFYYRASDIKI
jgi:hypothetical protein